MGDLDRTVLVVPESQKPRAQLIEPSVLTKPSDQPDPGIGVTGVKAHLRLVGEEVDEPPDPDVAAFLAVGLGPAADDAQEFLETLPLLPQCSDAVVDAAAKEVLHDRDDCGGRLEPSQHGVEFAAHFAPIAGRHDPRDPFAHVIGQGVGVGLSVAIREKSIAVNALNCLVAAEHCVTEGGDQVGLLDGVARQSLGPHGLPPEPDDVPEIGGGDVCVARTKLGGVHPVIIDGAVVTQS
jgi:hypothetical protein